MRLKKNIKGIALIQVLIISIILTMLGIYINQTVRSQVGVVFVMKDAFDLRLELENAEARILHGLLTNKLYPKKESDFSVNGANGSDIELTKQWNFYSKPFILPNYGNDNNPTSVKITLQDLSGLIGLNIISNTLATHFFEDLGYTGHEVRTFLDSLADWKDKDDLKRLNGAESDYYSKLNQLGPRNSYLQSIDEVLHIKSGNLLTQDQWHRYFTTQIIPDFNPFNAPEPILKAFLKNDSAFESVIELRNEGNLTAFTFFQATAIEQDEYISFATSRYLKVTIEVSRQNNKLSKQFIVNLRPRMSDRPVTISQITWNPV